MSCLCLSCCFPLVFLASVFRGWQTTVPSTFSKLDYRSLFTIIYLCTLPTTCKSLKMLHMAWGMFCTTCWVTLSFAVTSDMSYHFFSETGSSAFKARTGICTTASAVLGTSFVEKARDTASAINMYFLGASLSLKSYF